MMAITFPSLKLIEPIKALVVRIVSPETCEQATQEIIKIDRMAKNLDNDIKNLQKPYKDAIEQIKTAAAPLKTILADKRHELETAILTYNSKVRLEAQKFNAKTIDKFEARSAQKEAEAIAQGKPIPLTLPPALKPEPAKTAHVDGGRITESFYWTWDGLHNVPGGQEGAKKLTYDEAQRLQLDLPASWFKLDTAQITSCVKRNDRIPACVIKRLQEKLIVTATKGHDDEA